MQNDHPQLFLIPGMTPEYDVFARLSSLLPSARVVPFVEPHPSETLEQYAQRFSMHLEPGCILIGASFGGLLAQEVARVMPVRGCVLISSVQSLDELPLLLRSWCRLPRHARACLMRFIGQVCLRIPRVVRSRSTVRLSKLSSPWHLWATEAAVEFLKARCAPQVTMFRIHGDDDATFPLSNLKLDQLDLIIRGGTHVLPVTHPKELAAAINSFAASV